jgi:hypothetical protein
MGSSRGRPFEPGNKIGRGRPKGSRNKNRQEAQQLLDQHSKSITQKCIILAMQGDPIALRLCMERILPALREPSVLLPRTKIGSASDVAATNQVVWTAIASGEITPDQGEKTAKVLEMQRKTLESVDTEKRLIVVENMAAEWKGKSRGRAVA